MNSTQNIITKLKIPYIKSRRIARILAVQCIYILNSKNDISDINQIIDDVIIFGTKEYGTDIDQSYLISLVKGTAANKEILNEHISQYLADNWSLNRIAKVVQAILGLAVYEILYTEDATNATLINDYLEIAKLFNHTGEVGFINSIVDKVAKRTII